MAKVDIEKLEKDPDVNIGQLKNGKWYANVKTGEWDGSFMRYEGKTKRAVASRAANENPNLKKYILTPQGNFQ